jgi:endonuclease/exonuclease/phosphatase family metal-dependent hydrolase
MILAWPSRAALLLGLALPLAACDTPLSPHSVIAPRPGDGAGAGHGIDAGRGELEHRVVRQHGQRPADEALQLANARDIISGADMDVWGVAEIVDQAHWNSLESQLTGYTGLLAGESGVTGGSTYYGATEQKVGLLYKSSMATLLGAKIILTAYDTDFAGRPPLEVTLRMTLNGVTEDVVFIVLHAKAFNDDASWQRRANASAALKSYLDATYPTQKVFVVGDFNDDVDTSITAGKASPYKNFVDDAARYAFPTRALSDAGISSTTSYTDMIDHHLVTDEASATFVAGSVQVYRVDSYVANYDASTSDHYPVLTRYTFGGGGTTTPAVRITAPNGGESYTAGSSQTITWTSAAVADVKLEYTLDGTAWTQITASTPAAPGSYGWTVPVQRQHRRKGARLRRHPGHPERRERRRLHHHHGGGDPGEGDHQRDPGERAGEQRRGRVRGAGERGRHRRSASAAGRSRTAAACATPFAAGTTLGAGQGDRGVRRRRAASRRGSPTRWRHRPAR